MKKLNLRNYAKGKLWYENSLPSCNAEIDLDYSQSLSATVPSLSNNVFAEIELYLPERGSNYAKIGLSYEVENLDCLIIQTIGCRKELCKDETIAAPDDPVYIGIADYLKPTIMKTIKEYFQKVNSIPCGTLTVCSGLYSQYGSGARIFSLATECLLKIIFEVNNRSVDDIVQSVLDDEHEKQKEFIREYNSTNKSK